MLIPVKEMQGEDEEDTRLLKEMAERARNYITSFPWCLPISAVYFAYGIGKIVALFLFEFDGKIGGTDDKLWVVVGDLPSVYMVVEPNQSARGVLESYCWLMDDWVSAVRDGDFEGVYPVTAARTEEHADMLERRLAMLRQDISPEAPSELINAPDDEKPSAE